VAEDLVDRMAGACLEMINFYAGIGKGRWSKEDEADLRRLHLQDVEAKRKRGVSALSKSLKSTIPEMQDATRDGSGYPKTKEILDRWNISLNDLKIDAQDVLAKTLERGRITSHLNYYVCRTQFEHTSTLDPKTRNQLDDILEKFEQKWGA